ncbi:hypothetical protein C8J56DRAFT_954427 [Mycena floridula]|nr:hypothetical protein C8J56DRAFT_954427 [Mycena floridula]
MYPQAWPSSSFPVDITGRQLAIRVCCMRYGCGRPVEEYGEVLCLSCKAPFLIDLTEDESDMELVYPDSPIPEKPAPSPPAAPAVMVPSQNSPIKAIPTRSTPVILPVPKWNQCRSVDCTNTVINGARCMTCVGRDWKQRRAAIAAAKAEALVPKPKMPKPIIAKTPSSSKKSVSWADGYNDADELPIIGVEMDLKESRARKSRSKGVKQLADVRIIDVDLTLDQERPKVKVEPCPTQIPSSRPGWDSDLSSLTDSESDTGDTTQSDNEPVQPRLVIRIPALASLARVQAKPRPLPQKSDHPGISYESSPETRLVLVKTGYRKCATRSCRSLLAPVSPSRDQGHPPEVHYKYKCCPRCRKRSRDYARQKTETGPAVKSRSTEKEKELYPVYRSLQDLLNSFEQLLNGFVEARELVLRHRSSLKPNEAFTFTFSGQFSVVAANLNVLSRTEETMKGLKQLKEALVRATTKTSKGHQSNGILSVTSHPHATSSVYGGIMARFKCTHVHSVSVQLQPQPVSRPLHSCPIPSSPCVKEEPRDIRISKSFIPPSNPYPTPPPSKSNLSLTRRKMQGELELVVLPDSSHRLFAGERVVVRLRLVG